MSSHEAASALDRLINQDLTSADERAKVLRLPTGPAAAQLLTAVMCGGPQAFARGWRTCPEGGAFQLGSRRGTIILQTGSEAETRALLGAMSALTLDALLVALDRLCNGGRWVAIEPTDVMAAKGYRRWGEERGAFERRVLADLGILGRLQWRAGGATQPLFVIAAEPQDMGLLFSAGPALRRHVQPGRGHLLTRSVLALDHRQNRGADALAKKLAVALALRDSSGPLRSRDLLLSIGELSHAQREPHQARLVDRMHSAAARLRELKLYDLELTAMAGRRRGWVAKWLQTQVVARSPPRAGLEETR